jgi:hypothetical protein
MAEERIDKLKVYRDYSHDLHPVVLSKRLIEHGLAHLDELKPLLQQAADDAANS